MPMYHFATIDGGRDEDPEGSECASDAAARIEAIRYAGAVMNHEPDVLWDGRQFRVEVTDDDGLLLFTILMLAVDGAGRRPPPRGSSRSES